MTDIDETQTKGEHVSPTQRQLFPVCGSSVDRVPLALLIKVTKIEGEPLTYGDFNEGLVLELFHNVTEVVPMAIKILNDQDALVDLPDDQLAYEVACALHGKITWYDLKLWVHCIMATRESCVEIQKEREVI